MHGMNQTECASYTYLKYIHAYIRLHTAPTTRCIPRQSAAAQLFTVDSTRVRPTVRVH